MAKKRAPNKDLNKILKELDATGVSWRATKKGHYVVYPPVGEMITISGSKTGGHSNIKDALAELRRGGVLIAA
jgi:hypothetical protein